MVEKKVEKIYYINTNPDYAYTLKELKEFIKDGHLTRDHLIWTAEIGEWVKASELPELAEEFKRREEEIAKEMQKIEELKKQKEEIRALETEDSDVSLEDNSSKNKNGILLAILLIVTGAIGVISYLSVKKEPVVKQEKLANKPAQKIEDIDIEKIKLSSGVLKMDIEKSIKIQTLSKKEEAKLLKEALTQKGAPARNGTTMKKGRKNMAGSIFEAVSDEELKNLRKALLAKKDSSALKLKGGNSTFFNVPQQLSTRQIARVIKERSREVRYCYNKALKQDVNLRGKLEITLTILPNGRVARVEIPTEKFKGTFLARCIVKKAKRWVFPPFKGRAMQFTFPFVLTAD